MYIWPDQFLSVVVVVYCALIVDYRILIQTFAGLIGCLKLIAYSTPARITLGSEVQVAVNAVSGAGCVWRGGGGGGSIQVTYLIRSIKSLIDILFKQIYNQNIWLRV